MAYDFINLVLSGRLVKDVEMKKIDNPNGTRYILSFTIANNFKRKENETNFFDCQFWTTNMPNYILERLKKGTFVVINGYLKQEKWTSKSDQTQRSKITIVVTNFLSIDSKIQDSVERDNQILKDNSISSEEVIHEYDEIVEDDDLSEFNSFEEPNNFN
jgi:single stranded DNA-binding protein